MSAAAPTPENSGESDSHPTMQSPEQQQFQSADSQSSEKPHPTLPSSTLDTSGAGGHPTSRRDFTKMRRPSSPNASSAPITQASGAYTGGVVNRHPNSEAVHSELASKDSASSNQHAASSAQTSSTNAAQNSNEFIAFRVGVSEDRNQKCRRTMEDSHAFVYDFGGVKVCCLHGFL